ncbi:hypothetical protein VCHENC02_5438A, partial [Vibrio harveyi]
MTRDLV